MHFGWYTASGVAKDPMRKLIRWLRAAERHAALVLARVQGDRLAQIETFKKTVDDLKTTAEQQKTEYEAALAELEPRERAVQDVEQRADDEKGRAEPEEQELVSVLEVDEDRREGAESDAAGGERVRSDAGAGEPDDRPRGKPAGAGGVRVLDPREGHRVRSHACYIAYVR